MKALPQLLPLCFDERSGVRMRRIRSLVYVLLFALPLFAGCGDDGEGDGAPPATPSGFVDEQYFRQRQLDYLQFATTSLAPGNVVNVIAHLERKRVDPSFTVPEGAVPIDAWDSIFEKMANLEDTRDFNAIDLVYILFAYRDDPMLAPGLTQKVEEAMFAFKFWYVDPTPEGLRDDTYYWTENHQILYFAIEYLMGQFYPDRPMGTDGNLGSVHRERGRAFLLRWIENRARFGFSEWHSNVYYQEDVNALLTLVEFADEEEVRTKAAMVLDLIFFDYALHTKGGAFGATHGRSYKKDKMTSLDDDTWGGVKFLFDTAEYPYQSRSHTDATFLARAQNYRLPELIRRVALHNGSYVDRERLGIRVDERAPLEPNPVAPYGFSYDDPEDLVVWWGMSALTAWQIVPLTLSTLEQYNFWESELFADFKQLRPLATDPALGQALALNLARIVSFGHLTEVNTYTYRTPDYMLSSALDYRKGSRSSQVHAWQVTFDPNAVLFAMHPAIPVIETTRWGTDTESTGGYWTGEAALPRTAQFENVSVHIYSPQYEPDSPPPLDRFKYEPYTHAYVPQDHFDEVVQEGHWTFVRWRDGYAGLYSYRDTQWISYDPNVVSTNGMVKPFDLRAVGGPDNVWIVECGARERWGTFEAFREAVLAAQVVVTPSAPGEGDTHPSFDVEFLSPSVGQVSFGWNRPFAVAGVEQSLAHSLRYDNPWSRTTFNQLVTRLEDSDSIVELDFERGVRTVRPKAAD